MRVPRPLAGRQIVVTQAVHQAPELAALLEECGATVLLYPCIAIKPPPDTTELDSALAAVAAGHYDWLVLTSANTVRVLHQQARSLALPLAMWKEIRIAAVGAGTNAAAAAAFGRDADLLAEESVAEGLARSLLAAVKPDQRLLLPQADIARSVLFQSLADAGLHVVPLTAYHTMLGNGGVDLPALLAQTPVQTLVQKPAHNTVQVDAITFTSSSTVRNLLRRLADEGVDKTALSGLCLAAIGPVTAETIVCRTSNVDIAARSCELTFKVRKKTIRGREANELYATAATAGVVAEGAAGSNIESFSKLNCSIDAKEIRQKAGGGAQCSFETGK